MKKSVRSIKILAIFCLFSLTAALLLAYDSPAQGYELSIYDSTPWPVWLLLFIGFIGGTAIIVHQVATAGYKKSRIWITGLAVLLLSKAVLLLIPYIRGYAGWAGDHLTHLGYIKDILLSGHFPSGDFYPVTHGLIFSIISVTGTDIFMANLITAMLSILFVLFTYLLAKEILPDKGQQILSTLFASAILIGGSYNVYLMPNGWSIFLLPLIYYLYFKSKILPFKILFIFLLILYPLIHPLSALIVIVSIASLELSKWIIPFVFDRKQILASQINYKPSIIYVVIGLVSFLTWVLSFQSFRANIRLIWKQISTGFGPDPVAEIGWSLNKVNIHGLDFVTLLFKMYGAVLILILLSLIGTYIVMRSIRSVGLNVEGYRYLALVGLFFLTGASYAAYLIGVPGLEALSGGRILFYLEIMTPVLAVPALFMVLTKKNAFRLVRVGAVICVVFLASVPSIISLYPSPHTIQPSTQVTHMLFQGSEWFIEAKDETIGCAFIMTPPSRMADAIIGSAEAHGRTDLSRDLIQLPNHLGYAENSTLGATLSNRYVTVSEFDREIYSSVWKMIGRFNDVDFKKMDIDYSVSKIYSNGGFDVYFVY